MNKITSLQYLRAFACISVLITHVLQRLDIHPFGNYLLSGQYGVDLFFILSGFVIFYTTKEQYSWKKFAIRRICRIFPLYLFALLLYALFQYLFMSKNYTLFYLFQNIIMLPFSDAVGFKSLIVGQAWSTVYEMYFYSLMTLILFLGWKKRNILFMLFGALCVFLLAGRLNLSGLQTEGFFRFVYSLTASVHIFFFLSGIVMAIIYAKIQDTRYKIQDTRYKIFFIIVQVLFVCMLMLSYNTIISFAACSLFFISYLFFDRIWSENGHKTCKWLAYTGDISFSIYLIHQLVIRVLFHIFEVNNFYVLLLFTLVITLFVSHLTYRYIEKPFIALARKITTRERMVTNSALKQIRSSK